MPERSAETSVLLAAGKKDFPWIFVLFSQVMVGLFHGKTICKWMIFGCTPILGNHHVSQLTWDFPGMTADSRCPTHVSNIRGTVSIVHPIHVDVNHKMLSVLSLVNIAGLGFKK